MIKKIISNRPLPILCSILLFSLTMGLSACSDINTDNSKGEGQINFHLTNSSEAGNPHDDSKGGPKDQSVDNLDEVNIDVEALQVLYLPSLIDTVAADSIMIEPAPEGEAEWITVEEIEPQEINLLDLEGSDVLLGSEELEEGFYAEIRLILGSDNNVVVDGEEHSLKVPSGQQSGYKIKLGEPLHSGEIIDLTIEFDAEKSVKMTGNGQYMLKPVLKAFEGSDTDD